MWHGSNADFIGQLTNNSSYIKVLEIVRKGKALHILR